MIFDNGPYLCVGADPHDEVLNQWGLENSVRGLRDFNKLFVESLPSELEIVKPQVALYESFGSRGLAELESLLLELNRLGKYVIADAKRSDIGSSMTGYANAWLSAEAPFLANALTVSPFLGAGSLTSTFELAAKNGKHVFVLVATSNPEAVKLQSNGLSKSILEQLTDIKSKSVGVVIGATVDLEKYGLAGALSSSSFPILAPGFGVQGAELAQTANIFVDLSSRVIANVSRSVLAGEKGSLGSRIAKALGELS